MQILVFSWRDPRHPLSGGAEQVMHEHMKGWVAAGHEVTLFSSKFSDVPREEELDGVRIVRAGSQYLGVQWQGFLYYLKNRKKYDLIIDQFHGLPFFTPLYCRKPKLAVVQETAREVWFLNPLPRPLNWLVGLIGYLVEPFIFFLYKWTPFMTGSQSAREDVARFGIPKDNITVVPHGVIVKKPSPIPPKDKKTTIVYLGVLSKDKGIEDAIRCFSLVDKKGNYSRKLGPHPASPSGRSAWQFWVIGRPETASYGRRVASLVTNLGLQDKVKFWGFISQEKKFELLARAHLLINPSIKEGWGLVNIEANAVGTPVVAYRSPGLVDSVRDGQSGILCKENTPEKLAQDILDIRRDEALYRSLVRGALAWSRGFSWENSRGLSLDLIRRVVDVS